MKTKKYLVILAFVLTLCLAACAGKEEEAVKQESETQNEEMNASKNEEEASDRTSNAGTETGIENTAGTGVGEEVLKRPEEVTAIELFTGQYESYEWADEYETFLAHLQYPVVEFSESARNDHPDLAKAMEQEVNARNENKESLYQDSIEQARERIEKDAASFLPGEITEKVFVQRADTSAVSLAFDVYYNFEGDYEYSFIDGLTFDSVTGKKLKLSDMITDRESFLQAVLEQMERYGNMEALNTDLKSYVDENFDLIVWTLGNEGLTVYFNPGDVAEFYEGMYIIPIAFADYPELVKNEYRQVPKSWGTELSMGRVFFSDLDGDGELNKICITADEYETGIKEYTSLTVSVDEIYRTDEIYSTSIEPTLLHTEKGSFVYTEMQDVGDYRFLNICDISDCAPKVPVVFQGFRYQIFDEKYLCALHLTLNNPDAFELLTRTYLLGTYDGTIPYHSGENGIPEAEQEWYKIIDYNGEGVFFTVLQPLTADTVEENGNMIGSVELAAGDTLEYYRTDGESFADVRLSDGTLVRFYVNAEYPVTVNGYYVDEILDGVVFAG